MSERRFKHFEVRIEETPDELWARLLAHPKVRESVLPAPSPEPPEGEPFLIARASPSEIRLRHWAGPADAACPVLRLSMQRKDGVTHVRGRFVAHRRVAPLVETGKAQFARQQRSKAWLSVAVVMIAISAVLAMIAGVSAVHLLTALLLLIVFSVPSALIFIPAVMIWNGEVRKGFVAPTWELLGEVFTPIALPPESPREAPFRHALREGS